MSSGTIPEERGKLAIQRGECKENQPFRKADFLKEGHLSDSSARRRAYLYFSLFLADVILGTNQGTIGLNK